MSEIYKLPNIYKTRTTPYHQQCNILVERFNRTLLNILSTCASDHPFDWEQHICKVCFAYNSTVQTSTGYTPFYLMFGRLARLPLDVIYGMPEPAIQSPSEYDKVLHKQMTEAFALVRSKLATQHERQKDIFNHKILGKPYAPGNLVWLHSPVIGKGKSRKLHHPWTGPYKVIKKLSDATYRVQKLQGHKQHKVVDFDHLKSCPYNIRLDVTGSTPAESSAAADTSPQPIPPVPSIAKHLELVEDDSCEQTELVRPSPSTPSIHRYLSRTRRPPPCYSDFVSYS